MMNYNILAISDEDRLNGTTFGAKRTLDEEGGSDTNQVKVARYETTSDEFQVSMAGGTKGYDRYDPSSDELHLNMAGGTSILVID